MNIPVIRPTKIRAAAILLLCSSLLSQFAGIPEPGIVLYGVVSDGVSGLRITSGTLQIIYTDQTAGKSVTNLIVLQDLAGAYSYVSEIQFESALTNQPVTNVAALELPAPGASARTFTVGVGSTVVQAHPQTDRDTITFAQKGKLQRLDLIVDSGMDFNGLPFWWEARYFNRTGVNPNDDPDHDGMSNWSEYLAGTDPTNANSVLKLTGIRASASNVVIRWLSATGKTYSVLAATNADGPYATRTTGISATPPENTYLYATTNSPVGFYRISTP